MLVVVGTRQAAQNANVAREVRHFVATNAGRNRALLVIRLDKSLDLVAWRRLVTRVVLVEELGANAPTGDVLDSVLSSTRFTKRARRLQWLAILTVLSVAVVVTGTSVWTGLRVDRARGDERHAQVASALARAAAESVSRANRVEANYLIDPDKGLELAVSAVKRSATPEAVNALRKTLHAYAPHRWFANGQDSRKSCATGDGTRVYAEIDGATGIREWHLQTGTVRLLKCGGAALDDLQCSPVGSEAAALFDTRRLLIFGQADASPVRHDLPDVTWNLIPFDARGVAFGTVGADAIGVWTSAGALMRTLPEVRGFWHHTFLPGADVLVGLDQASRIHRFAVNQRGDKVAADVIERSGASASFAANSTHLLVTQFDHGCDIWTIEPLARSRNERPCQTVVDPFMDRTFLRDKDVVRLGGTTLPVEAQRIYAFPGSSSSNLLSAVTSRGLSLWDLDLNAATRALPASVEVQTASGLVGGKLFTRSDQRGAELWELDPPKSTRILLPRPAFSAVLSSTADTALIMYQLAPQSGASAPRWEIDLFRGGRFERVSPSGPSATTAVFGGFATSFLSRLLASPSGTFLAFTSQDGYAMRVEVIDTRSGARGSVLTGSSVSTCLALSDSGDVAVGDRQQAQLKWFAASRQLKPRTFSFSACPVAISQDSRSVILSRQGKYALLDTSALDVDPEPRGLPFEGEHAALTPDFRHAATIDRLGHIRRWSSSSGTWHSVKELPSVDTFVNHGFDLVDFSLSDDGTLAIVDGYSTGLHVWDLERAGEVWSVAAANESTRKATKGARFVPVPRIGPAVGGHHIAYVGSQELRIEPCETCEPPPRLVEMAERLLKPFEWIDRGSVDVCQ